MKTLLIIIALLVLGIVPAKAEVVKLICGPEVNIVIDTGSGTYTYYFIAPKNYKYGDTSVSGPVVVSPSRFQLYRNDLPSEYRIKGITTKTDEYVSRHSGKYHRVVTHTIDATGQSMVAENVSLQCRKGLAPKPKF